MKKSERIIVALVLIFGALINVGYYFFGSYMKNALIHFVNGLIFLGIGIGILIRAIKAKQ